MTDKEMQHIPLKTIRDAMDQAYEALEVEGKDVTVTINAQALREIAEYAHGFHPERLQGTWYVSVPDSAPEGDALVDELSELPTFRHGVNLPTVVHVSVDLRDRILTALRASDRDSVIEECAKVVEAHEAQEGWGDCKTISDAIRALKGEPK